MYSEEYELYRKSGMGNLDRFFNGRELTLEEYIDKYGCTDTVEITYDNVYNMDGSKYTK